MTKGKKRIIIGFVAVMYTGVVVGGIKYNINRSNNFERVVEENGEISLEGRISYKNACKYEVIKVSTVLDEKVYIVKLTGSPAVYQDIFTGKVICETEKWIDPEDEIQVLQTAHLEDYLIALEEVKESYSPEDIELIRQTIEELWAKEENQEEVKRMEYQKEV